MLYCLIALGLVLHAYLWGAGLAGLLVPRGWRRWWWVFAPGLGWALQSAVVWAGAHTSLAGTAQYARWSEALPLLLLGWVAGRRALPVAGGRGARGALVLMVLAAGVLIWPMAAAGRGLTASSLGSCDHADYAAGARVFQEFSRDDREGFMGLTEVTKVRSADYFFDYWLYLNHFTPSALLAHNAAVFGVEFYRLISVSAALLVALNLPLVLFLARVMMGIRGRWLLGLGAVYALAPLNAYAVHHGALGQLYAAQGIALLTVAAWGAERAARHGQRLMPYGLLMLAGFWLLAGSYNFILTVCLAPAAAWWLIQLARHRQGAAAGRTAVMTALALLACVALFWGRIQGLWERFSLLEQYNFGWVVPLVTPASWLGLVKNAQLEPWTAPWLPGITILALVAVVAWVCGLRGLWRGSRERFWAALALVVPVVLGWALLAWESRSRANASYDAYKLVSVFYPGLLAGFVGWLALADRAGRGGRRLMGAVLALLVVANAGAAYAFVVRMSAPPLRLEKSLTDLSKLEADPRFASLNMRIDDFWSRLWANALLLRKPQYFVSHTYEGRLNTALKGGWNLHDGLMRVVPLNDADYVQITPRFHVVRADAPGLLTAELGEGWYSEERSGVVSWCWGNGRGRIVVQNPTGRPVRAVLRLQVMALTAGGEAVVRQEERVVGRKKLDGTIEDLAVNRLHLPPGRTVLTVEYPPSTRQQGNDDRTLALALYRCRLKVAAWED